MSETLMRGTGAAPGRARGPAVSLEGVGFSERVPPGAILVAQVLHPYHAPLLLAARGVVVEDGGVLQHAVILAREFGIPAVVGVHNAVERLCRGDQVVELDGTSGTVVSVGADGQK